MSAHALGVVRAVLVWAASALVFTVAALAFVVSFEAISAFAVAVGAFPHALRYCAPLLVDSFTAAATLVILWLSLTGEKIATAWDAWYAWALIAAATCVSVAINVAHAPDTHAARLVAALPPVALLLAVELLLILARRCLAHPCAPGAGRRAPGAHCHTGGAPGRTRRPHRCGRCAGGGCRAGRPGTCRRPAAADRPAGRRAGRRQRAPRPSSAPRVPRQRRPGRSSQRPPATRGGS